MPTGDDGVTRWPGYFQIELGDRVRRGADVVLASDYDALKADLARLTEENEALRKEVAELKSAQTENGSMRDLLRRKRLPL